MNAMLLILLAEESSEVIQATTKILRFGTESVSPYNGKTNEQSLEDEVGDLLAIVDLLGMNLETIEIAKQKKIQKLQDRFAKGLA